MKLNAVDAAIEITDLRLPPSNRLEILIVKRVLNPFYSIRINDQWRLCFEWREQVEITDYH